jgi:hypothetical protein
MTSRIVRVGRIQQVITTTYTTQPDGTVHEHITLATPNQLTDTQRLRIQKTWENSHDWRRP